MSLKTLLQEIFGSIKKVFKKLDQPLKDALHVGVFITDKLKTFAESETADILTAIIPGEWDDQLKNALRAFLPKILVELKLAENCANQSDPNEVLKCAIQTLQQMGGDWIKDSVKKDFLDSLATEITVLMADGKFDWDDAKHLVKWYYDHIYKG
jgi:hypothetical protein